MYHLDFAHPTGSFVVASAADIAADYLQYVKDNLACIEEAPCTRYLIDSDEFFITSGWYTKNESSEPTMTLCLIEVATDINDSRMLCSATYADDGADLHIEGLIAPDKFKEASLEIVTAFISVAKSSMSEVVYGGEGGQRAN